jgi:hypothetical protein
VQRETVSHRLLRHPNIIAFKKARRALASHGARMGKGKKQPHTTTRLTRVLPPCTARRRC